MKRKKTVNNVKLGIFVFAGVIFLVFSLYMIGRNRNLFGPTFTITAYFRNINGLVAGNNVRFAGIDVGTVKHIKVVSDTSVEVVMVIDKKLKGHIKSNALAAIGTDGLVGNKVVNINSVHGAAVPATDRSVIGTQAPVETDEMLRTLQLTNNNIAVITSNLKEATERLNGSTSLWNMLADTLIVKDLKSAASHFNHAGANIELATRDASLIISDLRNGKGIASSVFVDTALRRSLEHSVMDVRQATRSLDSAARKLERVVHEASQPGTPVGLLLSDSATTQQISRTISNLEVGTERFSENMEALKGNFLFRGYFRRQEKSKAGQEKNERHQGPVKLPAGNQDTGGG
jgi:phospholipid/cholesterol/gamma-HCH transport system substrate-binding protein